MCGILLGFIIAEAFFLAKEIESCGHLIDATGVTMKPANNERVKNTAEPSNATMQSRFVRCTAWMSKTIPHFVERAAPLYTILVAAYNETGKRTMEAIAHLSIKNLKWDKERTKSFWFLQQQLQEVFKTAHRNPKMHRRVHNDAGNAF